MADRTLIDVSTLPVYLANKNFLPEGYTAEEFLRDLEKVYKESSSSISPEHTLIINAFEWLETYKDWRFWNDLHNYTCAARGVDELERENVPQVSV